MFDPEVEALPWAEQARADDEPYRKQVAYLFARSRFYRAKLAAAGFADAAAVGGLADIAALPFTEKDELAQDADRRRADRRASRGAARRYRPHLLDQRHHRRRRATSR